MLVHVKNCIYYVEYNIEEHGSPDSFMEPGDPYICGITEVTLIKINNRDCEIPLDVESLSRRFMRNLEDYACQDAYESDMDYNPYEP